MSHVPSDSVISVEDMVQVMEGSEAVIHLHINETAQSLNRDVSIQVVSVPLSATGEHYDIIISKIILAYSVHRGCGF